MDSPDIFILVVSVGVLVTLLSYTILFECCGRFRPVEKKLAVFPFMIYRRGVYCWTIIGKAWRVSLMVASMSMVCMWVIIWQRIQPHSWQWLTISQAVFLGCQALWVPMVKYSAYKNSKKLVVSLMWIATMASLGTLVVLWRSDSSVEVRETDIRVATTCATLVFYHTIFWDAYTWSVYFQPNEHLLKLMQGSDSENMPVMSGADSSGSSC